MIRRPLSPRFPFVRRAWLFLSSPLALALALILALAPASTLAQTLKFSVAETGLTLGPLNGVAFGNGTFVVSTNTTHSLRVFTSADAVTWRETIVRALSSNSLNSPVRFVNGKFLLNDATLVGNIITTNFRTSSDGLTWTTATASSAPNQLIVEAVGDGTRIIAGGTSNFLVTSVDGGTRWTNLPPLGGLGQWTSAAYGAGRWFLGGSFTIGFTTTPRLYTGTDGISFTLATLATTPTSVAYGGGRWLVVGQNGDTGYTSSDGVTFTATAYATGSTFDATPNSVRYVNNRFISLRASTRYLQSTDGVTWSDLGATFPAGLEILGPVDLASGNGKYVLTTAPARSGSASLILVAEASIPLPAISTQPSSQTIPTGANATLSIAATGTAPVTYQWRKDGAALTGATNATLTLSSVRSTDAGSYTVVVTNSAGSLTSDVATLTVTSAPSLQTQPISQTITVGAPATFSVVATGSAPLTYQWHKDGVVIFRANDPTLTLSSVRSTDAGSYTVVVTNSGGSSTSEAVILTVRVPGRLINLSVLTDLVTSGEKFTLGYVVGGGDATTNAKTLVIRAAGPSLGALNVPGTLTDPKLELFAGSTKTDENDNWGGSPALTAALSAVGAFAYLAPTSKDSALVAQITTRDNSVAISSADNGTGKVIAEIYDATPSNRFTATTPQLINVSVRQHLGSGLTAGFVIGGGSPLKVLVRAVGPGLAFFGVPGTVVDPQLILFNATSTKIAENNDWGGTPELTAAFASVGAFALPAATSKDAALLVTLPPGNYTAQASGVNATTGVALVEVYEVP